MEITTWGFRASPSRAADYFEGGELAARFGADLPVAELVARAVCSECRARWPRISCRRRSFKRLAFPQALLRVAQ